MPLEGIIATLAVDQFSKPMPSLALSFKSNGALLYKQHCWAEEQEKISFRWSWAASEYTVSTHAITCQFSAVTPLVGNRKNLLLWLQIKLHLLSIHFLNCYLQNSCFDIPVLLFLQPVDKSWLLQSHTTTVNTLKRQLGCAWETQSCN